MRGDIPPLPNMLSWRRTQLYHRHKFIFILGLYGVILNNSAFVFRVYIFSVY
jgi:hypothetical protein